jgi:hypothetical protein
MHEQNKIIIQKDLKISDLKKKIIDMWISMTTDQKLRCLKLTNIYTVINQILDDDSE